MVINDAPRVVLMHLQQELKNSMTASSYRTINNEITSKNETTSKNEITSKNDTI